MTEKFAVTAVETKLIMCEYGHIIKQNYFAFI